MSKRRVVLCGTLIIVLLGMGAWAFGFFNRTDAKIAELKQIGEQMKNKDLPEAQRNEMRDDFRQQLNSLSDEQRRAFFDSNRDQWMSEAQKRMDEYFAMSKADQKKHLDEILDRIVKSQQSPQNSSQQSAGAGGQQSQNNRGNRGSMTDAQREERAKKRLERTTPAMRAQFAEFRKQLDTRAQQRGISVGDPRGGWGGGGGIGRPRGA